MIQFNWTIGGVHSLQCNGILLSNTILSIVPDSYGISFADIKPPYYILNCILGCPLSTICCVLRSKPAVLGHCVVLRITATNALQHRRYLGRGFQNFDCSCSPFEFRSSNVLIFSYGTVKKAQFISKRSGKGRGVPFDDFRRCQVTGALQ